MGHDRRYELVWHGGYSIILATPRGARSLGVIQLLYVPEHAGSPDTSEILKRRFARGEITREEFEEALAAVHS